MRWPMVALIIILGIQGAEAAGQTTPRGQTEDARRSLEIHIELAWLGDPITFPYFLEARADKTRLEVRGYVPSRAVREHALKIASLHSHLTIVDKLREHPSLAVKLTRLPAPQMQTSAHSALRQSLPSLHQLLEVQAGQDGTVTIRGAVNTNEQKLAVSQALRRLHGCVAVHNLLDVMPEGKLPTARIPIRPPAKTNSSSPGPVIPASKVDAPQAKGRKADMPKLATTKPVPEAKKTAQGSSAGDPDLTTRIQKKIQQICPGATDIQVQPPANNKIRISVHVQNEKELEDVAGRIFALSELQSYEIDLHIMAPAK